MQIAAAEGMDAYAARPETAGPWPGVVVIFDIVGMSRDLERQTEWLASEGFAAIAPDLYHRGSRIHCVRQFMRDFAAQCGPTFDDVEATRSWLVEQPDCTGTVGIIGFCLGGGFALVMAPNRGFAAASANYGRLPKDFETYLADACPIVASYGAKDRSLRGVAAKLEHTLERAGVPHDVREYPGAGHSFMNDHDPGDVPAVLRVAMRLSGNAYHEPSAADARKRIVTFFDTHLGRDGAV